MIVVRNVFQLHFGKAKEAIALLKESQDFSRRLGFPEAKILADVTGEFYTLVLEFTADSLTDYESRSRELLGNAEWQESYQRLIPLVRSGRREIFRIVD